MSQPPTLAEQLAALGGEKITDVKTTSSSTSSSLLETLGYAAFGLGAAAVALGVIQYTQKSKSSSKSSSSRQSNKKKRSKKNKNKNKKQKTKKLHLRHRNPIRNVLRQQQQLDLKQQLDCLHRHVFRVLLLT